jgi:hypothetical protein
MAGSECQHTLASTLQQQQQQQQQQQPEHVMRACQCWSLQCSNAKHRVMCRYNILLLYCIATFLHEQ